MTHNEKVLALLSDGLPHTHHEIYGLFVIGHSRIADLRKRGHVINCWRDGDDYLFQLCSEGPSAASPQVQGSHAEPGAADVPLAASSEQLSLVAA